jgi:alpha-tubulin suppressor-like RCC1 family protein
MSFPVKVGDVLASAPTKSRPDGYILKVTAVTSHPLMTLVTAVPATLEQAVPDGSLNLQQALSKVNSAIASGLAKAPSARIRGINSQLSPRSKTNLNCSGLGKIAVSPQIGFDFQGTTSQFKWNLLKTTGSVSLNYAMTASLILSASAAASCSANVTLLGGQAGSFLVDLGIPVVLTPTYSLKLQGDATADGHYSQTVDEELAVNMTAKAPAAFSSTVSPETKTTSASSDLEGSVDLGLKVSIDMKVDGGAGLFLNAGPQLKLSVNSNESPWWTLDGCVKGGFSVEVREQTTIDDSITLNYCKQLAAAPGGLPATTTTSTTTTSIPGTTTKVSTIVSAGNSYCALLTSGGVDCWGYGREGELGDGQFYLSGNYGSAVPVAVENTSESGPLGGVASLVSDDAESYCALLISGGVDCWGYGPGGQIGDGEFYDGPNNYGIASPVPVENTSGSGFLGGVAGLASNSGNSYCAVLISGGVDCWGSGQYGQLGDGQYYTSGIGGADLPVEVIDLSGSGTLDSVASLASGGNSYCALLTSGGAVCWGEGSNGELGNGLFYTSNNSGSAVPVSVVGTTGSGTLGGISSLASSGSSYCALLTSGAVDCWGYGAYGQLGDNQFYGFPYSSGTNGSATPVFVTNTLGSGTMAGVASLSSGGLSSFGYCAVFTLGGVNCWGNGQDGQLGDGQFYPTGNYGSALPVTAIDTSDSGNLSGVASVASDTTSHCALLTSGGVDCWGNGVAGQLGDGQFYASGIYGSAVPVAVIDASGSGTFGGVASLASGGNSYCALLTSRGVDCWGQGWNGELGDGQFYTSGNPGSAVPVAVTFPPS